MEKLEFSTNWNNKLDCKCFTTIRIFNPAKHFRGNQFEVFLQRKFKNKALVLGITIAKLEQLNDYVCYLDTGYNRIDTINLLRKIYPSVDFAKKKICIILLEKIEPPKPKQGTLIKNKMKIKHKTKNKKLPVQKLKNSTSASDPKKFSNIKGFKKR